MPGNPARFMSVEKLLEHGPSLRRLALDLARDEAGAEDLVQETWMVALRRTPPAQAEPGPWLRGVLRNVFRAARRGEGRRQRREALASRREAARDPSAGLLERAEILRRIVGHVLELEPIYREAILLRYFEDLSPAEVAERLGVPADTVHTRLRRGIEKLRKSLDDAHGGGRRAWALVLLPGVPKAARGVPEEAVGAGPILRGGGGWKGATVGLGGLAMSMKTVIPAAALAAALLGLGAIALLPERDPSRGKEFRPETVATVPGPAASLEAVPSLDGAGKEEIELAAPLPEVGAELIARIRGSGGEPIPGAALEAVLITVDPRTLERKEVTAARGASDGDGEFRFQGLEPGTYEVRAVSSEHRPARSEEVELDEGNPAQVAIELAAGRALEGVVLDPTGRPVAGALVMSSRTEDWIGPSFMISIGDRYDYPWAAAEVRTRTDPRGCFRLSRLPSGNRQLLVRHPDWAPAERGPIAAGSRGIEVRLERGASVEGRVRDAAGGRVDGLRVRAFVRNHHPLPEALRAGFESRADASGGFRFEKVPREPLRIEVALADGRTETLDVDVPGRGDLTGVEIVVPAGGVVRGRVVSSTGEPLGGAAIDFLERTEIGRAIEAVSLEDGTFAISGVKADLHCTVSVRSPGRPRHETRFRSDLETDLGDIVLEDGLTVGGMVVATSGAPVPRSRVDLFREGQSHERAARADRDGRFLFDGLRPGTYSVQASAEGFLQDERHPFTLGIDGDPPEMRVVLAEGGPLPGPRRKAALTGRVRDGNGGHAVGEFQVFADAGTARSRGKGSVFLDPEGNFALDDLSPGDLTVRIFARGYAPYETRITLEPGEAETILADLERGGSISGTLRDAGGQPVAGARVFTVSDEEARQHRAQGTTMAIVNAPDGLIAALTLDVGLPDEARSGDDGAFLLEGLRPGRAMVRIDHPRFSKRFLGPIEVPNEGTLSLGTIHLESGATIEGVVHGAEGKPVRGGSVHVQPMGDVGPVDTFLHVPIGRDGTYRKEGLEAGRAWIEVDGRPETGREVELDLGATLRTDFRIPATE